MRVEASVTKGSVSFYTVPTDAPEADGTFSWDSTSMVLVQLECGETRALGYTYADAGTAAVAQKLLEETVVSSDPMQHAATRQRMLRYIRNLGETGVAMMAVSALDNALWDLRARLLDVPLVSLLGQVRACIPVYGSGGFTSYTEEQLSNQSAVGRVMDFERKSSVKRPLLGRFKTDRSEPRMLGSLQKIHLPMRRFREADEVDYLIVGCGSAGGVLLQRLARAGFNVVALEAGPFWDTERDWVSD